MYQVEPQVPKVEIQSWIFLRGPILPRSDNPRQRLSDKWLTGAAPPSEESPVGGGHDPALNFRNGDQHYGVPVDLYLAHLNSNPTFMSRLQCGVACLLAESHSTE